MLAVHIGGAILDKDTITAPFAELLMSYLARDPADRQSELYTSHVRPTEYQVIMDTALAVAANGCTAIIDAPLLNELSDPSSSLPFTNAARLLA